MVEANCRFRWSKTLVTQVTEVHLLSSFTDNPLILKWNKTKEVYESDYIKVPLGAYQCQLVVGEEAYPLEPFEIHSYTFEVNIEVKDDLDQTDLKSVPPEQIEMDADAVADSRSSSIKRYEQLVRQQMSHGEPTWPKEVDSYSLKSDSDRMSMDSRHSRNSYAERQQEIITDTLRNGGDKLYNAKDLRNSDEIIEKYQRLSRQGSLESRSSQRREETQRYEQSSQQSSRSSRSLHDDFERDSLMRQDSTERYERSSQQNGSHFGSRPGSITSEQELDRFFEANERHHVNSDRLSERSSSTITAASYHSGTGNYDRYRDDREPERRTSANSLPPVPTQKVSQEDKRSMTPDTYSRIPKPTSPRERQPNLKSPLVTSRTTPLHSGVSSRASTRNSTPVVANGVTEHGSREDALKIQDLEDKIVTFKKLLADRDNESRRLQREIQDLSADKHTLKKQLDEARQGQGRGSASVEQPPIDKKEFESRFDELLREKENLATEVWKLRQELDAARSGGSTGAAQGSGDGTGHLDNYNPNNPYALQRKIGELESQIQDLQEASESTVLELAKGEKRIADLEEENRLLKETGDQTLAELREENKLLKEKVTQTSNPLGSRTSITGSEDDLRSDIARLRAEMKKLREQNHYLNEENIQLRDELRDLRRRDKGRDSSYRDSGPRHTSERGRMQDSGAGRGEMFGDLNDRRDLIETAEKYRQEKISALEQVHALQEQLAELKRSANLGYRQPTPPKISDYMSPRDGLAENPRHMSVPDSQHRGGSKYSTPMKAGGYLGAPIGPAKYEVPTLRNIRPSPPRAPSPVGSDCSDSTVYLTTCFHTSPKTDPINSQAITDLVDDELGLPNNTGYHDRPSYMNSAPNLGHVDLASDYLNDLHVSSAVNGHYSKPPTGGSISKSSSMSSIVDEIDNEMSSVPSSSRSNQRLRTFSTEYTVKSHRSHSPTSPRVLSPSAGLRTVSPPPLITQHNKGILGTKSEGLSTVGKRPFAPRNPADVNVDDVVKFSRQGGKITRGLVKYIGHLPGRNDTYLGVELEHEEGKHDGTFNNQRYFRCKPNKGVFVAFNKVVMVYGT